MKTKGKVIHFLPDHRYGGPHRYVEDLKAIAQILNLNCSVVTNGSNEYSDLCLINFRLRHKYFYILDIVINVFIIIQKVVIGRPKSGLIFHIHGVTNLAPVIVSRLFRIRTIWHIHESSPKFRLIFAVGRRLFGHSRVIYLSVCSKAKHVYSLPSVAVVPPIIDSNYWRPALQHQHNKTFSILTVGNINPFKGQDLLLAAAKRFPFPYKITIVGATLESQSLYSRLVRDLAKDCSSGGGVVDFLGFRNSAEVLALMQTTDIFVLPSRSEGFPIALMEAMSVGCSCIATAVGGVPDLMNSSKVGVVVEANSSDALFEGIDEVMRFGPIVRRAMGARARDRVISLNSRETFYRVHSSVYGLLLA